MPTIICPECDESVQLPPGTKSIRCPACGMKLAPKKRPAEPDDEDEPDEPEEKPRRKPQKRKPVSKPARRPRRTPGFIPLVVLGPICTVLAVSAPFSGFGTALSMVVGTLVLFTAVVVFGIALHRDPDWSDEASSPLARFIPIVLLIICVRATLADPRRYGRWAGVGLFGLVTLGMGITADKVWKTMDDRPGQNVATNPAAPAPNAGGEPRPGTAPAPTPAPTPPPDPGAIADKAITTALAGLGKPDDFSRMNAAADLGRMTPKADRRAEVVQKLEGLTADANQLVRVEAVKSLGVWGTPDDVPTLVGLLDHADGWTRRAAALAVRRFRDPQAIPALVRHLRDPQCTGESAKALIDIGSAAEKPVIPSLAATDITEQGAAIDVLKEIGTVDSVPALQRVAAGKTFWANKAADALKLINARSKKKK